MRKRLLFLLVFLIAPLGAQEVLFNHVPDPKTKRKVEAMALFNRPAPGGFLPVRVTVNNPSEQEERITISTESSDGGYGGQGSELTSSFDLTIPAERTSIHDLLVPCTTLLNYRSGGSINVSVRLSGSYGGAVGNLQTTYGSNQPALLLSEPLFKQNASMLDGQLSSLGGSSGGRHYGGPEIFSGRFDPRAMPEDWRAYSGYDGIAMTDTDWGNASPGARTAMLRWNRLGGELVIYRLSSSSDLATLGIASEGKGLLSAERSFGRVTLLPVGSDLKLDPADTVDLFHNQARMTPLNDAIQSNFSSGWKTQAEFGQQTYNYGLFILILVAFGILVGPVNLFVFAKSGRRHRLFITTPLIALGTSVVLIALIILIDGFGGRGYRTVLMEVRPDDGENSAYVLQEQVSRTGVLLGGGFTVSEPAVITSVPLAATQWSRLTDNNDGGGMRYEEKFDDGKLVVDGDWFQSRSEQGHFLRAIVPTRGRIEARSESGTPSFLSTFDFPIATLYYHDNANGWWKAENIVAGKAFTCTAASPEEVMAFVTDASGRLAERSRRVLSMVPKTTANPNVASLHDRPGHFIALTENAPAIETLKGIDWTKTRTYITGPVAKP